MKANKDVHVFFNGDLCESAIKTSKGDIFHQVGTPQDQRDWVIQTLAPISKQILGFTTGNHENRIYNDTGIDLTADIANAFEVPYRSEGMLFKLSFGDGNNSTANKPFVFSPVLYLQKYRFYYKTVDNSGDMLIKDILIVIMDYPILMGHLHIIRL